MRLAQKNKPDSSAHSRGPLHAVGHYYGRKVVLSAAAGATGRKLHSLLLLQPAVSHLCFSEHGGYWGVRAKVELPILSTYSAHDFPLHEIFHLALRRKDDLRELRIAAGPTAAGMPPNDYAALGGYGPRGAGEELRQSLPAPRDVITMPADATIIGLDGTVGDKIRSHGDVISASTAWLLQRQLAL